MVDRLVGAAGHRHFGADDVIGAAARGLGSLGQPGGALCDHFWWQGLGVAGAGHAGVEMDLGEAGFGVGAHHRLRLGHRRLGRLVPPRIGAKMITAEDQALGGQAACGDQSQDEVAKLGRLHPGVAALLVDLVTCSLHQQRPAVLDRPVDAGFEHHGMGRAHRADALSIPGAIGVDDGAQDAHGLSAR